MTIVTQLEKTLSEILTEPTNEGIRKSSGKPLNLKYLRSPNTHLKAGRAIIVRIDNTNPNKFIIFSKPITIKDDSSFESVSKEIDTAILDPTGFVLGVPNEGISEAGSRFDINLREKAGVGSDCYLAIDCAEVESSFLQDKSNPVFGKYASLALIGDETNSKDILSMARIAKVENGNIKRIIAFCDYESEGESKFSIGLRVGDDENDFVTGIIVDPKVKNDG
ncbi:MAG: hypothetical protein AAGK01_00545 [Pseudomonadota bacterium]